MNDISALRGHLFNTLQALQDKENPMDIERAKAVCQVGSVIIDSAKAEIDFAKVNGSVDTQFFNKPHQIGFSAPVTDLENHKPAPIALNKFDTPTGKVSIKDNVLTHRMR
jgi:hypothetical protein